MMAHSKRASKRKRRRIALPVLGAAGASLAMAGGAAATVAIANVPSQDNPPLPITLYEEEIFDVNLATFYVFDRENADTSQLVEKFAARGCRGCAARGCGGCRGCRGCAVRACRGCGGCGCGGVAVWGGCGGCGGCGWGAFFQMDAPAAAAEAAVAGLAYNGRHWAGSGSANRVISAPKSDRAGLNRDPRYQVGSSSAAFELFTRRDTGPRSGKLGLAASFCIFQFIDKKKEHRHERCHQLV